MKVGVIGSGGREHAICISLKKSKNIDKIYCFPGNAGTSFIAENIEIELNNFEELKRINKSFEKIFIEPDNFVIDQHEDNWIVSGPKVDKITNLKGNSHEVLNEISYRFEKSSISNELKNRGIEKGDIVDLNGHEFSYE